MNPLAVYIHWPFCKAKCPYCDFNSHVREGVDAARWQRALLRELEVMAEKVEGREVVSIFFGGGTPSLMPPALAGALIDRIQQRFRIRNSLEITLEANPTSVEREKLGGFKLAGVNRLSMGVQSLRPEALKFLGREHSAAEAMRALEVAASLFDRYSFDLIYALPHQTLAGWEQELSEALALARGHLSLYQLTIEPNTAFATSYAKGAFTLPEEELAADLYERTEALTGAAGMRAYEVSNYAAPGQECRHNLAYWRGEEYLGIGPGAHGRLQLAEGRVATATVKSPERWLEAVEREGHGLETYQPLSPRECVEERILMGLRLAEGIPTAGLEGALSEKAKAELIALGLLEASPERLRVTRAGRLVLSRLSAELLAEA